MNVAPWCYKWISRMDWISPGASMYRALYGANNEIIRRQ